MDQIEHIRHLITERQRISAELAQYGIDVNDNVNLELPQLERAVMEGKEFDRDLLNQLRLNMHRRPPGWLDRNEQLLQRGTEEG